MKKIIWTMCMLGTYMAHAQVDSTQNVVSTQIENYEVDYMNPRVFTLEDIDVIINFIKKSESAATARQGLVSQYHFTENQAKKENKSKPGKIQQ